VYLGGPSRATSSNAECRQLGSSRRCRASKPALPPFGTHGVGGAAKGSAWPGLSLPRLGKRAPAPGTDTPGRSTAARRPAVPSRHGRAVRPMSRRTASKPRSNPAVVRTSPAAARTVHARHRTSHPAAASIETMTLTRPDLLPCSPRSGDRERRSRSLDGCGVVGFWRTRRSGLPRRICATCGGRWPASLAGTPADAAKGRAETSAAAVPWVPAGAPSGTTGQQHTFADEAARNKHHYRDGCQHEQAPVAPPAGVCAAGRVAASVASTEADGCVVVRSRCVTALG